MTDNLNSNSQKTVRTRFAPSPTGFMHVGGIRTALFAWLLARQNNGKFMLRLEDTDKKREVEGSDTHLMNALKTLGIIYDEGPDIGGPFAPYKQSERLDHYKKWAQALVEKGRAYADPYTQEQIDSFRADARANKKAFLYRDYRPTNPPKWDGTTPLRLLSDPKSYNWHDEIMGDIHTGPEVIDDIILIKSDGYPTYNFAHIIDDMEMETTHIIRGHEFLPSHPNYLNIYEALGIEHPLFVTVPPILGDSGTKKLGKRDGAKDAMEYLNEGYLVETMINFIVSLGWNDGTEQEIFSVDEIINKFKLSQIQHSGARFDEKRLLWMNGQWIRRLSIDDLYVRCENFWSDEAKKASVDEQKKILALVQDRLKTLADLPILTSYFFSEPVVNWSMIEENKQLAKLSKDEIKIMLETAKTELEKSDFDAESIQNTLNQLLEITGQKPGILFSLIRLSVSWSPFSPALNETLATIGKEKTTSRLAAAIQSI